MTTAPSIFLVEDDLNFGTVLKAYLEMNDFEVTWVDHGNLAIPVFKKSIFDICILDVMLPGKDGFTIAEEIKHLNKDVPFIFLTAKNMKNDIVTGFQLGADDYITKPFDSELLLYKVRAILNRKVVKKKTEEVSEFKIGRYTFNPALRILLMDGVEQKLSPKEAQLLKLICTFNGEILPRETALKTIWGADNYFTTRSMDVFVTKLRKYLKDDPTIEIVNYHGTGYRLTF